MSTSNASQVELKNFHFISCCQFYILCLTGICFSKKKSIKRITFHLHLSKVCSKVHFTGKERTLVHRSKFGRSIELFTWPRIKRVSVDAQRVKCLPVELI